MALPAIMPLAREGVKLVGKSAVAGVVADKVLETVGLRDKDDEDREVQEAQVQQMQGFNGGSGFNPNEIHSQQVAAMQPGGGAQFLGGVPSDGFQGMFAGDGREPGGVQSGFGVQTAQVAQSTPAPATMQSAQLDASGASMAEPLAVADAEPEKHGSFMQTAMSGLAAGAGAAYMKWKETFENNPDASVMDGVVAAGKGFALGAGSGALTKMSLDGIQDENGGRLKAGLAGAAAGVLNSYLVEGGPGALASAGVGLGSAVGADVVHDKLADAGHERAADAAGLGALSAGSMYSITGDGKYAAGGAALGAGLGGLTGGDGVGGLVSSITDNISGGSDLGVDSVSPSAADDMELGE